MTMTKAESHTEMLLNVFPIEVWRQVIENVDHVQTYKNICASCPFFEGFPTPNKVKVKSLFPNVVPLLRYRFERRKADHKSIAILKLRLVCRDWKDGVDSMLQICPEGNMLGHEYHEHMQEHTWCWLDKFKSVEEIAMFQEYFDDTHYINGVNPFVSRSVFFQINHKVFDLSAEDLMEYCHASISFLRKYGHHVWYFAFSITADESNFEISYNWMRNALEKMTNLKSLWTDSRFGCFCKVPNEDLRASAENAMICAETIRFIKINYELDVIGNAILKSNPQITMLDTIIYQPMDAERLKLSFPNLSRLQIKFHSEKREVINSQLQLWKTSAYEWPLTKLDIEIIAYIPCQLLFDILENKFEGTLTERTLSLRWCKIENSSRLCLPHLQVLKLTKSLYNTLDFLLPMKDKLEKLAVHSSNRAISCGEREDLDADNVIKFYSLFEDLHRSNMWEMFPKLKLIENVFGRTRRKWMCNRSTWRKFN